MKRTLLAGIAAVTMALAPQAASAADVAVKARPAPVPVAAPSWSGLYIGVNAGYLGYRTQLSAFDGAGVLVNTTQEWQGDGGVIGGTIGWNWHLAPAWLIGVEADWDWSNADGDTRCFGDISAIQCRKQFREVATVRGRLGWFFRDVLLYATGGWTWAKLRTSATNLDNLDSIEVTKTENGANIGFGVEWEVLPYLTFKTDVLYHDLGTNRILDFGGGDPIFSEAIDQTTSFWTIRLGLNYRFGWFGKSPVGKAPAVVAKY
jgi:outer membrane immunogenic protein